MQHFTETVTEAPEVSAMARNIEAVMALATADEALYGLQWYAHANQWAREVANEYDLTLHQVAQLTSLLSPQQSWPKNQFNVRLFLDCGPEVKMFATKAQKAQCEAVVDGHYWIPSRAQKTYAFAECIENPEGSKLCVIDRHAIKIAWGQSGSKEIGVTAKRYREAVKTYNLVATKYGLKAHQVQAITWVVYKRIVSR